jgi:HPr kinase/phosphorylase
MAFVSIQQLIEDLPIDVIYLPKEKTNSIKSVEVNRPGLQLTGFYKNFPYERVQIIGKVEWIYFETLDYVLRKEIADKLLSYPIPCLIFTRNLEIYDEFLHASKRYHRPLLRIEESTTKFISRLINYLEDQLAPVITRHGVLVEVYGIGILMIGESGIGKSETALELIKRGHRLVADDAVEIKKINENTLLGCAPEVTRYFMEIRGLGILDIVDLYGTGAVRDKKFINMVVELENWDESKEYDRLGLEDEYIDILGNKLNKIVIPIKPGRNLAMLVEAAAKNYRQKKMGFNAVEKLNQRILQNLENRG